ncbi:hypothetical protein [Billgrantia kenyensis]|uniref:Uncharacterized protein n=1 Tax=Billgrantia kenyensis TaxID=321266 RepID=A0A7V9W4Q0_9GAMM|nr:hypothetical protein [Halomonas kenyensis]MBA2781022.1 hypothetical protein [Halomonas kenyensis]MCG6663753.1 hypothetical protein [Halomonas kenyensis]
MSQATYVPIRQDEEVLRFWASQASHQQAAFHAIRVYLETLKTLTVKRPRTTRPFPRQDAELIHCWGQQAYHQLAAADAIRTYLGAR